MQMTGQILTGSTQTIATKKGDHLQKTRLKVLDLGPEASGGDLYWIDFLGEAALSEDELRQIARQQVTVEVRRMYASTGKQGSAFLNANGGAIAGMRCGWCSLRQAYALAKFQHCAGAMWMSSEAASSFSAISSVSANMVW